MRKSIYASLVLAFTLSFAAGAQAAGDDIEIKSRNWPFEGVFGSYDQASLQRGLQVYKEVCAACHGLRLVAYRNLEALGYTEDQVKAYAKEFEVQNAEPNEEGEMFMRAGLPSDRFVSPFPNDEAARAANNGALPVDLSLIVKARANGANYLYSLLTGYQDPPQEVEGREGLSFNVSFPGQWIAMPPPLLEDGVEYSDGTKATVDQMAYDVTNFLAWAASPKLEDRKKMGLKVMIFLAVFTGLLIAVKKKVWSDVH
ncbi:MAG: cytochrome c1 [Alphaproteobacteria bacterium]|nr:cytochrome c1 [Alphaproteobacteria bacterium]